MNGLVTQCGMAAQAAGGGWVGGLSDRTDLLREWLFVSSYDDTSGNAGNVGAATTAQATLATVGVSIDGAATTAPVQISGIPAISTDCTVGWVYQQTATRNFGLARVIIGDETNGGSVQGSGNTNGSNGTTLNSAVTTVEDGLSARGVALPPVVLNKWRHETLVLSGGSDRSGYYQGLFDGDINFLGAFGIGAGNIRLGVPGINSERYHSINFGLVYIYDKVLTAPQIADLHSEIESIMLERGVASGDWQT